MPPTDEPTRVSHEADHRSGAGEAAESLSWEDPGARTTWRAFRETSRELLRHPGRFVTRMAREGGLREPLLFYWIILACICLLSFPLTLAYFGISAPAPSAVSLETYELHLLPPRLTGFVVVLLPVVLPAAGVGLMLTGSIFHLGARLFGNRGWECSVSIWCYAKSASALPIALGEALACILVVVSYAVTVLVPETRDPVVSYVRIGLWGIGGLALLCSVTWFFVTLIAGCIQACELEPATGVASALAGILLTLLATSGPVAAWFFRGWSGGLIALGGVVLVLAILTVTGHMMHSAAGSESET